MGGFPRWSRFRLPLGLVGISMMAAFRNSLDPNPSPGELLVLDILVFSCFSTPTLIKEKWLISG